MITDPITFRTVYFDARTGMVTNYPQVYDPPSELNALDRLVMAKARKEKPKPKPMAKKPELTIKFKSKHVDLKLPLDKDLSAPWSYTLGCELTFTPKREIAPCFDDISQRCNSTFQQFQAIMISRKVPHHDCGTDPQVIEVPTKPYSTWEKFKSARDRIAGIAAELNFAPHRDGYTGGGGHIHVKTKTKEHVAAVQRDAAMRPYMSWAFNHYSDDMTAHNFFRSFNRLSNDRIARIRKKLKIEVKRNRWGDAWVVGGIDYMVLFCDFGVIKALGKDLREVLSEGDLAASYNSSYQTIEYRMFDAADTCEIQQEQCAFAQAYTRWIELRLAKGDTFDVSKLPFDFRKSADKAKLERWALREFKKLIVTLGLPWARYQKYTENIQERFLQNNLD